MNAEMKEAINAIAADKGMKPEVLYAVLADALESAYKKMSDAHEYAWVTIDPDSMEYRVIAQEIDVKKNASKNMRNMPAAREIS